MEHFDAKQIQMGTAKHLALRATNKKNQLAPAKVVASRSASAFSVYE